MVIVFSGVVGFASIRMIRSMMTVGGVMPALQIPKYYFAGCVTVALPRNLPYADDHSH